MNCAGFNDLVGLYGEGDLGGRAERDAREHLAICPDCRQLADEFADTQRSLKSLRREIVDPARLSGIRSRVLEQLAAEARNPAKGLRRWLTQRPGWAYASVVVAVGLGLIAVAEWLPSAGGTDAPGAEVAVTVRPVISEAQGQTRTPSVAGASQVEPGPSERVVPEDRGRWSQDEMKVAAEPPRDSVTAEVTLATAHPGEDRLARPVDPGSGSARTGGRAYESGRHDVRIEGAVVSSWKTPEGGEPEPAGVLVKLATKDPEIVLYWIVDQNGD